MRKVIGARKNMFSAIVNVSVIFLLVLCNIENYCSAYRSAYVNYARSDESSINLNDGGGTSTPLPTRWSFNEDAQRESRQPVNRINDETDDSIHFPTTNKGINLRTVPSCAGKTFCEDVAEYPSHLADEIIKKNPQLRNYQNDDAVYNINGLRIGVPSTTDLCPSHERVVYMRTAENAANEWRWILNTNNFTQGVRVETCIHEDETCRIIEGLASGYVSSCKQRYVYRQFLAMTSDGKVVQDAFRIPASCCCHVEFVADVSTRSNSRRKQAN